MMVFSYNILSIIVIFCTSCLCQKSFGRNFDGPETLTILDSNITWKGWTHGDLDSMFYYKSPEELKESSPSDVSHPIDFDFSSASSTYGGIWAVFNVENGTRISTLYFDSNQNQNGQNIGAGGDQAKSPKIIDFLVLSIYLHDKSYIFPYKGPRTSNEVIRKISHEDTEQQKFYNISIPIGASSFTLEFGVPEKDLIYIDKMTVVFKSKINPTLPTTPTTTIYTTPSRPTSVEITQQQTMKYTTLIQTKPSSTSLTTTTTTTTDHDRDVYMVNPTSFVKNDSENTGTTNTSTSKSETEEKPQFEVDETSSTSVNTTEISAATSVERLESEAELNLSEKSTPSFDEMGKLIFENETSSSTSVIDAESSSSTTDINDITSTTDSSTTTTSSTTSKPDEITTKNVNKKTSNSNNNNNNTGNQIYLSFTCLFVFTALIIMR